MVKVKNIIGSDANIEDQVNKFLEQCDEKGFVVRNITLSMKHLITKRKIKGHYDGEKRRTDRVYALVRSYLLGIS